MGLFPGEPIVHRHRLRLWLLLSLSFFLALAGRRPLFAQGLHQAALVVDFGDGRVLARVVAFSEESLSGVELLERSGLQVALTGGWGGVALCAVEGVGCPPTPQECFCQCRGGTCRYWGYFHLQEGGWVYAQTGAAERRLRDGDVDGWIWGDGRTPPRLLTWEEILTLAAVGGPSPSVVAATPVPPTATPAAFPSPVLTAPATGAVATAAPELPSIPASVVAVPATQRPTAPQATLTPSPVPVPARVSLPAGSPRDVAAPYPAATEGGTFPYAALGFGAIVAVLVGLGLWVRRRR